jgi:hypothetical protein
MDSDEQAAEQQWRQQEQQRQRYQAVLDRWVEDQRADAAEERRLWRVPLLERSCVEGTRG